MDWLPEELNWSGFRDAPTGLREVHCGALRDTDDNPRFAQPPLYVTEVCLQVYDEQRCLTGRGYDGRVVSLESQLNVAGKRKAFR
jgi:hypothetical protein